MEIFQDSLAASLALALVTSVVLVAPFWWMLGMTKLQPALRHLVAGLDFLAFAGFFTYILHAGLLA